MRNNWIKCIRQEINDFNWLPSKNARICSDHFCNKDYKGYNGDRKVMLKEAFPCFQKGHNDLVNNEPYLRLESSSSSRQSPLQIPVETLSTPCKRKMPHEPSLSAHKKNVVLDHKYYTTPTKTIKQYKNVCSRMSILYQKYRNSMRRESRLINKCKHLMDELKDLKLINEEMSNKLEGFDEKFLEKFKKDRTYGSDQKSFALTLHLYGPKAYDYLRTNGLHLPHTRTLRK
ncbi:hypothetical protein HELRODRAFT_181118 [Helobdella robusta]|uniref:THAP-type domain-containing protein n=1 Tax=Helobdella robusta TaxID=6412 RepID=T1FGM6_HELRO|nr:hypothetical protein HELRODRAFT_181118 [Helobdella robusta]ESN93197.1 hypothetical protein HELRODRAFT_181118 [Helobdella robusta]